MKSRFLSIAVAAAVMAVAAHAAAPPGTGPGPGAGPGGGPGTGAGPLAGGAPGQARRNYPFEAPGTTCPRATLKTMVDDYSAAMAAHDPSRVKVTADLLFTENGVPHALGASDLWKGAGTWPLQNYLLDTERCGAVTFGVITENGRPIHAAIRLQTVAGGAISEIEHVLGRENEFMYNPQVALDTKYLDWENILPPDKRQSRGLMAAAAADYFEMFSNEPMVNTPFASRCDRWENGIFTTPTHDCSPKGLVIRHPAARVPLADVEAGLVAAFIQFAGSLADIHVFKMSDGRVDYALAVVGPASPDTWGERERAKK